MVFTRATCSDGVYTCRHRGWLLNSRSPEYQATRTAAMRIPKLLRRSKMEQRAGLSADTRTPSAWCEKCSGDRQKNSNAAGCSTRITCAGDRR